MKEYPAVRRSEGTGQRLIDAIILPKGETKIAHWKEVIIESEDIIVVQTKKGRLGMYLMGQTFFST